MAYYILDNNNQIQEIYNWHEHRVWFEENKKRTQIGFNHIPNGLTISTIFLATSPKMGNEKLLFETHVWGDSNHYEKSDYPVNYYTYEDALKGHLELLKSFL